jgi:putative MFS transporter
MFEILDRRTSLTGNQIRILAAAIIGDALEFFDYFLIGFVLAFLIGPWKLTFGQSATVLISSGIGAIIGAYAWGWLADRIGRRKVFIGTVLNFSVATGLLYFTPDNGWIYLAIMRFFVGMGVGGLYCVDLPLVQEFMPSSKRGWVGGLGTGLGAVLGASVGSGEWRTLFAIGCTAVPARPAGSSLGTGIAALALSAGPLQRGARVARLGAANGAIRATHAYCGGRWAGGQIQLV